MRLGMRVFTEEQLAEYDGLDGSPAHVGYDGKVYDVSGSFLWQKGKHLATHLAGRDLTQSLADAPHGPDLLARFPVVGVLEEE